MSTLVRTLAASSPSIVTAFALSPRSLSSFSARRRDYVVTCGERLVPLTLVPLSRYEASGGQAVELAELLVECPGGDEAAQGADASGGRAGGVAQLRLRIGRGGDDRLGDGVGIIAHVDRSREHFVEHLQLLR